MCSPTDCRKTYLFTRILKQMIRLSRGRKKADLFAEGSEQETICSARGRKQTDLFAEEFYNTNVFSRRGPRKMIYSPRGPKQDDLFL